MHARNIYRTTMSWEALALLLAAAGLLAGCGDGGGSDEPASRGCEAGTMKILACGDADAGEQLQLCVDGVWEDEGGCVEPACDAGETRTLVCGASDEGEQAQRCVDGAWEDHGPCIEPKCNEGDARSLPCGEGGAGKLAQLCIGGEWTDEGACIECDDGAQRLTFCATNPPGIQPQRCVAGSWTDEGACYEAVCAEGTSRAAACASDADLIQLQVCEEMRWVDSGACYEGECKEGEVRAIDCGPHTEAGLRPQCVLGFWENGGACVCPEGLVYDALAGSCVHEVVGCDPEAGPFGGGEGIAESPFLLCAPEHLKGVRDRSGQISHYVLAASLDLSGETNFAPLGTLVGSFYGAGRALVGLTLAKEDGSDLALFTAIGDLSDETAAGSVRDLVLRDFDVRGTGRVAALAAQMGSSADNLVEGVRLYGGTVAMPTTNDDRPAGGLIAHAQGGDLENNTVFADVSGYADVGGMVGRTESAARVSNSWASGVVRGDLRVGGLVGSANAFIIGGTASGSVEGNKYVGGLVGNSVALISKSSASGKVEGGMYVGGLVGESETIEASSASTSVHASGQFIGGLAGTANGPVSDSQAEGRVSCSCGHVMDAWLGGLVGLSRSTISRSHAYGDVIGPDGSQVGGLVGSAEGTITQSSATGKVEGMYVVGGLVGGAFADVIMSSARGDVSGHLSVGGLIGTARGEVVSSYAMGDVHAGFNGAGLLGNTSKAIRHSWSSGAVLDSHGSAAIGGLVHNVSGEVVIDSCWTMSAVEGDASLLVHTGSLDLLEIRSSFALAQGEIPLVGNAANLVDTQAISLADFAEPATFTDVGWDFEAVWTMGSGGGIVAPDLRENPREDTP